MLTIPGIEVPQIKKITEIVLELWISAWSPKKSKTVARRNISTPFERSDNTKQRALQEHNAVINACFEALGQGVIWGTMNMDFKMYVK